MNEQERRQEILKAEEVIRQLAGELGRTKDAASLAEMARGALTQASAQLLQAKASLDEATMQSGVTGDICVTKVGVASDQAKEAIRAAEEQIGRTVRAFEGATERLDMVAKDLRDNPHRLAEVLKEELAKLTAEFDKLNQEVERTGTRLTESQQELFKKVASEITNLSEAQKMEMAAVSKLLKIVLAISLAALLVGILRFVL